jgi:hypothetical protein
MNIMVQKREIEVTWTIRHDAPGDNKEAIVKGGVMPYIERTDRARGARTRDKEEKVKEIPDYDLNLTVVHSLRQIMTASVITQHIGGVIKK